MKSCIKPSKFVFRLGLGFLLIVTETLTVAVQEQAIRTKVIKAKIDRNQTDGKCRMGEQVDETMNHITSECSKMYQEYKKRHGWVGGKRIHWEVCKMFDLVTTEKWYEHQPELVIGNESSKILWDFSFRIEHLIEARRADLIVHWQDQKAV